MNNVELSYFHIGLAAVLAIALALLFRGMRLGISGTFLMASARMVLQLTLIGYVLRFLFEGDRPWLIAVMVVFMLAIGSREIVARQKRKLSPWRSWKLGASTLFVSSLAVALYGLFVVVRPDPWYSPQYVIPLLGMIISNTMNAISLGMDRLTSSIYENRRVVEQRLALGESSRMAIRGYARDCMRTGMMPVVNSMATAGIVALPGMMTGQILAGASPLDAVKYQILIWFLIATGCGCGMAVALRLVEREIFDDRERLRLERLS